jgi:hypothetical protein
MPESSQPDERSTDSDREAAERAAAAELQPVAPASFDFADKLRSGFLVLVAAGGGAFALLNLMLTPCVGATRSSKLQWEERQRQIDQALAERQQASIEHEQ